MNERAGVDFTLRLGRALQAHGAPAHRLEEAMREVADTLSIEAEFFSTPTVLLASIGKGEGRQTHLFRVEASDFDLTKMTELTDLGNRVIAGHLPPAAGLEEIDRIQQAPSPYSREVTLASFAIASTAASRFFGAGPRELMLVFVAGVIIGLMSLATSRAAWLGRIFEPVAGLIVSLIATLGVMLVGPVSVPIVTVSGLIVLVPGFTLTVAVNELANRSLIAGTARLHGAIVTFLMLGFGVALGGTIGAAIVGGITETPSPTTLHPVTEWIAVAIASVTLGILFRAPRRDLGWIALACLCTFGAVSLSIKPLGPELAVFIGAFVAGVASNVYARMLDRPAAVTRVPSMMLLVPGGLGFLSISSLLEQDVTKGLQTAFSVAIMAVALVTGLLISNAVVPTRKKF